MKILKLMPKALLPLALLFTEVGASVPQVTLLATPAACSKNTAIMPVVVAEKTTNDLIAVALDYSWDNVNWSALAGTVTPLNPKDWEGNALWVSPTTTPATLYIRGKATDSAYQTTTVTKTVTVGSASSFAASVLTGTQHRNTYNYGQWWMKEASGTEKLWWTGGRDFGVSGGDGLYYQQLGSNSMSQTLTTNTTGGIYLSDPAVLKGSFPGGYSYAMYYTELAPAPLPYDSSKQDYNRIALVLSVNGSTNWTTPTMVVDSFEKHTLGGRYGAGFVSVVKLTTGGGSRPYCMFNSDSPNWGSWPVYFRRSADGITWESTKTSNDSDVTNLGYAKEITMPSETQIFSKFSFYDGYWYVAVATKLGTNDLRQTKVYRAAAQATTYLPGTWEYVGKVSDTQVLTRKETPAFKVDENGHLSGGTILLCIQTSELNQWPGSYPYEGSQFYYAIPDSAP